MVELLRRRLLGPGVPAHNRRVVYLDELHLLQAFECPESVLGAFGRIELPNRERRHFPSLLVRRSVAAPWVTRPHPNGAIGVAQSPVKGYFPGGNSGKAHMAESAHGLRAAGPS